MTILKTFVPMESGIFEMDTIEHEGMLWLVPEWIETQRKGWSRPARIICLSPLLHSGGPPPRHYALQNPIPKGVWIGQIPPQLATQYVVIEAPDLEFETHAPGPVH
jgi:hypothetical protein